MTLDNSLSPDERPSSSSDDGRTAGNRHIDFDPAPDSNEEFFEAPTESATRVSLEKREERKKSDGSSPLPNADKSQRRTTVSPQRFDHDDASDDGSMKTIFLVLPKGEREAVSPSDLRKRLKEDRRVGKYPVEFMKFVSTGFKARNFAPQLKRNRDSFSIPERSFLSPEMIVLGILVFLILILSLLFIAKESRKQDAPESNESTVPETELVAPEEASSVPAPDPSEDDPFKESAKSTEPVVPASNPSEDDPFKESAKSTEPVVPAPNPSEDNPFEESGELTNPTPEPKPTPDPNPSSGTLEKASIDAEGWLVAPFDVSQKRIPEEFRGHNFDRVCAALARANNLGEALFGQLYPTSKLAFVIPNKASVETGVPFFNGACDYVTASYLPAPKEMTVKKNLSHFSVAFFDGTKVAPLLLGEGAKGLALESPFEEDFKWANSDAYYWKIRGVRRDEFEKIKDKVAVLCVLNVDYRTPEDSGLLRSKGNYALYSRKAEFWVYNSETGAIYGKFDLAETLQENPHPHDVGSIMAGGVANETPRRSIGTN